MSTNGYMDLSPDTQSRLDNLASTWVAMPESHRLRRNIFMRPSMSRYCPHCDRKCLDGEYPCYFCHFLPWDFFNWKHIPTRRLDFYDDDDDDDDEIIVEPAMFPRFRELPAVVRRQIWEQALPGPRIVYLYVVPLRFSGRNLEDEDLFQEPPSTEKSGYAYKSPSTISIATVCREARSVVERSFTKAFPSEDSPAETWFNFETDTLFMDWGIDNGGERMLGMRCRPQALWCTDFERVHRLATFTWPDTRRERNRLLELEELCHETLMKFRNLEVYTTVARRYENKHLNNLAFLDIMDIDTYLAYGYEPFDGDGVLARRPEPLDGPGVEALRYRLHTYRCQVLGGRLNLGNEELLCHGTTELYPNGIQIAQEMDSRLPEDGNGQKILPYKIPIGERKIMTTPAMVTKVRKALANFNFPNPP